MLSRALCSTRFIAVAIKLNLNRFKITINKSQTMCSNQKSIKTKRPFGPIHFPMKLIEFDQKQNEYSLTHSIDSAKKNKPKTT